MPYTIKLTDLSTPQAWIIPDATPYNDGVMTKLQAAQLANLVAGGGAGLPDQTGHAGEFLTTDGTNASWAAVSGGGVSIGDPVGAATPGSVLFVNGLGNLAQDNPGLTYDGATLSVVGAIDAGSVVLSAAGSLTRTSAQSTMTFAGSIVGAVEIVYQYTPVEAGVPPFQLSVTRAFNASAPPDDWIASWGWNVDGSDAANAQFQFTIEQNFNGVTEFYIATAGIAGAGASRPFSIDLHHATGGMATAFNLDHTTLQIQDAAGGNILWKWTATGTAELTPAAGQTPIVITTTAGTTAIRVNGIDFVKTDVGAPFITHIAQDNTPTTIGRELFIGEPSAVNASLIFRVNNGGLAVGGGNEAKIGFNSNNALVYSYFGAAFAPVLAAIASQTTVGAAGAADPPPASPERYWEIVAEDGVHLVVPAYLKS